PPNVSGFEYLRSGCACLTEHSSGGSPMLSVSECSRFSQRCDLVGGNASDFPGDGIGVGSAFRRAACGPVRSWPRKGEYIVPRNNSGLGGGFEIVKVIGFCMTRCWRRQSRANPSLKPNSLLAGKIQGILLFWASGGGLA